MKGQSCMYGAAWARIKREDQESKLACAKTRMNMLHKQAEEAARDLHVRACLAAQLHCGRPWHLVKSRHCDIAGKVQLPRWLLLQLCTRPWQ